MRWYFIVILTALPNVMLYIVSHVPLPSVFLGEMSLHVFCPWIVCSWIVSFFTVRFAFVIGKAIIIFF